MSRIGMSCLHLENFILRKCEEKCSCCFSHASPQRSESDSESESGSVSRSQSPSRSRSPGISSTCFGPFLRPSREQPTPQPNQLSVSLVFRTLIPAEVAFHHFMPKTASKDAHVGHNS